MAFAFTGGVVFALALLLVLWGGSRLLDAMLAALGAPTWVTLILALILFLIGLFIIGSGAGP